MLFPAGCHQETDEHDAKAHGNVPGANGWNRPSGSRDVVGQDPGEAKEHEAEHDRLEPHRVVVALFVGATRADGIFGSFSHAQQSTCLAFFWNRRDCGA